MNRNSRAAIDRQDIAAGILIGIAFAIVKFFALTSPDTGAGSAVANTPFILTIAYIIHRARREPEMLDTWGITTPLTKWAIAVFFMLLAFGVGLLAAAGLALGDDLALNTRNFFGMFNYIVGAFPQQFFMCSVGLASLATLPALQGHWRLPVVVGILFGLAHFWAPVKIPGSSIPIQVIVTIPLGFFAAYYFLRFRNILPLTLLHAILFILHTQWVAPHLDG